MISPPDSTHRRPSGPSGLRVAAVTLPRRDRGSVAATNVNVALAVSTVRALAAAGPDLICLPENFLYEGLADRRPDRLAVTTEDELIERFADLARECDALVAVPFLEASEGGLVYNSVVLLDAMGGRLGVYRKQILWPSDPESSVLEGGLVPGVGGAPFATPFGPVGIRTCLEVQYPQCWSELAGAVELVLFPSEQGGGMALRARAQESRSFVVSAVGKGGPSALIDPVGHVAAEWRAETPFPVCDLSLDFQLVHRPHRGKIALAAFPVRRSGAVQMV